MNFKIVAVDDEGSPTRICTDDGFMQTSRKFIPDEDGWMLNQLDPKDFPIIEQGRLVESLVYEVNALRRKVFSLNRSIRPRK